MQMAMRKVDAKEPATSREQRVLEFWKREDIFQKSEKAREGRPEWVFYEGPPTANGLPHPGHVLTRVFKDLYPRYRTMKGYHVMRKAGWDTHGLPVEIEIEKKFGMSGKKDIQAFGIERFVQACRESVFKYEEVWRELTERLGYWIDLDHPYMTLTDDYIESVWHLLKTIYDKGWLVEGHRVSPYCPHCETTLSSHEVAQGYKDVKDLSVTAKFRAKDDVDSRPTYFLAWTTTPWTLPSNVGLAVNEDLTYVLIHKAKTDENVWVAEGLQGQYLEDGDRIIAQKSGRELVGSAYTPVFPYVVQEGKKHIVIASPHVTDESGTGIVHMSPAHGEEDYKACQAAGLIFVNFVDESGRFTKDVSDYEGRFVKDEDLNVDLVKDLASRDLVYEKHKHEHSYPHCWRCDTPLIYYAIHSWFIRTTEFKDALIANSQSVNWIPPHIRDGRMGNFLENVIDWNLSRSRYWGTPLPIWRCDACGEIECIGSRAELEAKAGRLPQELHKPYIDELVWPCRCGRGTMVRVPEVIDVWFDSGSMPFAQLHYPFENRELFERLYPADFVCEAIDQTRGWFYSLLAISTAVTGKAPYKNVLVLGHVLDEHGKKMSKSKGNVIDPFEAFDKHGADAVRFYFVSNTQPWNSQLFYHRAVTEAKAKFIDLLQNIHQFYALYAGIDGFNPYQVEQVPVAERPLMDRWLMARLHQTIQGVDEAYERYDATQAARLLQAFVDELSTWYVRRNRDRFWADGMEKDKVAAYLTLFDALKTVALLTAPITPFLAEDIYQNVVRLGGDAADVPESVHLCDFPVADASLIDEGLIREMALVLRVVEMGRHLRNESKLKTRQPLAALYVPKAQQDVIAKFADVIQDELNVKEIRFVDLDEIARPTLYLNLNAVGKAFGRKTPVLNEAAKNADEAQIRAFRETGAVVLEGETLTQEHAEIRFEAKFEGLVTVDNRLFVGLETRLTPELIEEGYVREVISKMQMMRKEVDYGVTHHVRFHAEGEPELLDIIARNRARIDETVLVREWSDAPLADADLTKEWDVNGKKLTLSVAR
ncbi:isoleucine--tRNA ligase [Alicyclobacillus mali]|uniref:Isoleucine--tRNA ligase n=3 Tax=Alicyclobacillus mali (ex Roth et al. 2021) TaxID=1123961 RepID=A0ABS0F783_9BACL|nr:isoleucine--tRNA ligase [Alicyclobacillus mali (ex Roth et al. 2021)]MBF8379111.1 isoleucine--tRNA ligase [Alicyclobacillus mali (ex Roth et al. 2021)]